MINYLKSNKKFDVIFVIDVLHHIGVEDAHKVIKNYTDIQIK